MGINASAHRVNKLLDRHEIKGEPVSKSLSVLGWSPTITVRPLTPEEIQQKAEELPELCTSNSTRLMLNMMEPFRKREGVDYEDPEYYETLAFSTIAHEEFVQAHRKLTYFWQNYTDSAYNKEAFDAARDFIRECALNNYYATYG